jgi:GxxExxY protein
MSTNYTNSSNGNPILQNGNLLYKEEVYQVVGAAMEVHKHLGCGFLEPVYQEAMELEMKASGIPFIPQQALQINYKGTLLQKTYVVDFLVFDKIVVEIKALNVLTPVCFSQVLNYLKASNFKVGLLINFGSKSLEWKRIIH